MTLSPPKLSLDVSPAESPPRVHQPAPATGDAPRLSAAGDRRAAMSRDSTGLGALLDRHPELQIERDDYNINVTANFGEHLEREEVLARFAAHRGSGLPAHLYFHVPLCSYICHFCNYVKRKAPRGPELDQVLDGWVSLLLTEARAYRQAFEWTSESVIESLYFGGGTAALLRPTHLSRMMNEILAAYRFSGDCERSLEGNPDNFCDPAYVKAAMDAGFNRFSVGIQSLSDEVTRFTNREHDSAMSLRAIGNLVATGVPFNADLMFGLPYQSVKSVEHDVRTMCEIRVPTITIYRLRNADRAAMGIGNRSAWNVPQIRTRLYDRGLFPSLEETYDMRESAVGTLLEHGYRPSPCGWWNAPGTYPDGNIPRVSRNKWQRQDTMIAHGPGAYGWLTGGSADILQTHNTADIAGYASQIEAGTHTPIAFGRLLTGHQAVATALGFAFKANQPIDVQRFRQQFGVDLIDDEPYSSVVESLIANDFLEWTPGNDLRPTLAGEALHEEIISVYIHGRIGGFGGGTCKK